jgi:hypothetical protein
MDWSSIVKEQLDKLKDSGLLSLSTLKLGVVHNGNAEKDIQRFNELMLNYYNYEIMFIEPTTSTAESSTIIELKKFCDESIQNYKILYIHSKGVTHQGTENEIPCMNWREMMEYFLIENWTKCVDILEEGYNCCGINYQNHSASINGEYKLIKIFNGNFFWVNSFYVKKIDKNFKFETRFSAENWILSEPHNAYSLFNTPSHVNLYKDIFTDYK